HLVAAGVAGNGAGPNNATDRQPPANGPENAAPIQAGQTSCGSVGVAAFQNTAQGEAAIGEVRGLPAGSYLAGLSEGEGFMDSKSPFQPLMRNGQIDRNNPQSPANQRAIDARRNSNQNMPPANLQNQPNLPRGSGSPNPPAN